MMDNGETSGAAGLHNSESEDQITNRQEQNKTNLIVNYLPQQTSQRELMLLFANIGRLESCKLIKDKQTGQSLGYGFVKYFSPEDAEIAVSIINGLRIHNKTIRVTYARPSSESITGTNLYVSGLPKDMSHEQMEAMFRPYGRIISSRILCDIVTPRQYLSKTENMPVLSKGVGFVRFNERMESERAVKELNGSFVNGSSEPITVKFANTSNKVELPRMPYLQAGSFAGPVRQYNGRIKFTSMSRDPRINQMVEINARNAGWTVFVYNIPPDAGEQMLLQMFGPFGAILSAKVIRNLETNACKGYGFVTFINKGPAFWGLINPEWSLCNKGRRQSPVNLEPSKLLFDPNLRLLHVDKHRVSGSITNTGHSVIFTVENDTRHHINVTGGPLSYKYQFHEIHIHYGLHDQFGSEHSINGYAFPAEIQIFGFNSQLYSNFSEALHRAQGIAVISLLLQLGDLSNPELRILTEQLDKIRYGGEEMSIKRLSIRGLLPDTDYYMTYDGSTTMPACHETVTWLILNKPIYITKQQLHSLRRLMQGDEKHPKAPLGNNFRPPQPLHNRPIRTNIDFNVKKGQTGNKYCPSMYKDVYYKANSWKQH